MNVFFLKPFSAPVSTLPFRLSKTNWDVFLHNIATIFSSFLKSHVFMNFCRFYRAIFPFKISELFLSGKSRETSRRTRGRRSDFNSFYPHRRYSLTLRMVHATWSLNEPRQRTSARVSFFISNDSKASKIIKNFIMSSSKATENPSSLSNELHSLTIFEGGNFRFLYTSQILIKKESLVARVSFCLEF